MFFLVEDLCSNFVAVWSEALGKKKLVEPIMASVYHVWISVFPGCIVLNTDVLFLCGFALLGPSSATSMVAKLQASSLKLCTITSAQQIITNLSQQEKRALTCWPLCFGLLLELCLLKGKEKRPKGHWTPKLGSDAWQLSLHLGSVNTSVIYSYLVQRNSVSPELFYFSNPGPYQIFPNCWTVVLM